MIDDYNLNGDLLTIMLARAGVPASQAISAEEGFGVLAAGYYDVCLVDYSLAGMNGLDFVHEVRSHKKYEKLALIMVSGVVENISYSDLKNQGLDGFIKKPFLQYQILNAIRITVQNRREKKDAPLVTRHNLTKIIDGREEQVSI